MIMMMEKYVSAIFGGVASWLDEAKELAGVTGVTM